MKCLRRAKSFFTIFARRILRDEVSVALKFVRLQCILRDEILFVTQSVKCSSVIIIKKQEKWYTIPKGDATKHNRPARPPVPIHFCKGIAVQEIVNPVLKYRTRALLTDRQKNLLDNFWNIKIANDSMRKWQKKRIKTLEQ
ncbi:hypothetical protein L3X38_011821 [Prunus dulcis]|uniref:Uncharacterized protein n=1 Tax=Prunus dulcis TaxID=3755 RepID=A0AAD4ZFE9_PRUDU|nr:hypothetical protein L3X38_011821 [Prunus dulcis]